MTKPDKPAALKPTSIALAMAAIIQDISAIPKDQKNQAQGFNFRGIDQIYTALHPIFAAHGVCCLPQVEEMTTTEFLNAKGNKTFRSAVKVAYHFTASDGSSLMARTVGEAFDMADKATNKAMSAAHKYLLLQTFLIPTADLKDADAYDYTIDAGAALREPGAEYADKPQPELEALRDEIIRTGQMPPAVLLGKIAELRCAAEDAKPEAGKPTDTPGAAPTPAATALPEPAAPAEPRKAAKAAPKPAAPQEAPPAPAPAETPAAAALPEDAAHPYNHVIAMIKNPKLKGRKLGELALAELETINERWVEGFKDDIAKNPAKTAEAAAVLAALALRREEA